MNAITETIEAQTSKLINPDPFCEVRLQQIEHKGKLTDKHMIEIMDAKTGEYTEIPGVSTVHSAGYNLVTNKQVHELALGVINQIGMPFEPIRTFSSGHSKPVFWNTKRFSEKWYSPAVAFDEPVGGSKMMLGMEVTNSYDGSSKVGLAFFAIRLACSNQFYSSHLLGKPFEFSHLSDGGDIAGDILGATHELENKAAAFARLAPMMKLMADTHVTSFQDFLQLRKDLQASTGTEFRDKQILNELTGCGITKECGINSTYEDPSSFWSIANAYTAVTTHGIDGPRGSDVSGRVVDWMVGRAQALAVLR